MQTLGGQCDRPEARTTPGRTTGHNIELEGILAYIRTGISNGRSEGMNGKARVITRRAFGFHSATSLIAMLFLCCSRVPLTPRHA